MRRSLTAWKRRSFAPFSPAFFGWVANNFAPSTLGAIFGQKQYVWLGLFIALGIVRAGKTNRTLLALLLPVALTFVASFLRLYPISDRLEIFWIPLLTPFLALGVAWACEALRPNHRGVGVIFALLLALPFLHPLQAVGSPDFQQLKQATLALVSKAHAGDVIYLHPRCIGLYKYYFKRYPPAKGVVVDYGQMSDLDNLRNTLAKTYPARHVFVAFTEPWYVRDELQALADSANVHGELRGVAEFNLAGIFELQLSPSR